MTKETVKEKIKEIQILLYQSQKLIRQPGKEELLGPLDETLLQVERYGEFLEKYLETGDLELSMRHYHQKALDYFFKKSCLPEERLPHE